MQSAAHGATAASPPAPVATSTAVAPQSDPVISSPSTLSKLKCYRNRDYVQRTLPHGVKCLVKRDFGSERAIDEAWSNIRCDVTDVQAKFDGTDATIFEGKDAMQITLPEFWGQASVNVRTGTDDESRWEVGWVTACYNYDTYARLTPVDETYPFTPAGKVFCNIPARFVSCGNDACSPWHSTRSYCVLKPDADQQTVTVTLRADKEMRVPDVQWTKMVGQRKMKVFNFKINDQYYSWLVARNVTKGAYYALYTVVWERRLSISVDVAQPIGNRTKKDYHLLTHTDSTEIWPLPEIVLEPVYLSSSLRWSWYPEDPLTEPLFRPAGLGDLVRSSFAYAVSAILSALFMYYAQRRLHD